MAQEFATIVLNAFRHIIMFKIMPAYLAGPYLSLFCLEESIQSYTRVYDVQ